MQLYKLNQLLLDMHSGGTPDTSEPEYWNGDYKWLASGETRQRFIDNTESRITQLGIEKSSTKLAKKNDVVMACAGQGKTRGQVSFLLDDMYINQSIIAMTTDEKILHPLYLFYNLSGRYNELRGSSDASSTRGSITIKSLKKLAMLIPNIESQKNITDILIAYDNLIENNNRRICLLEKMAENLYKEWFVRFRFPGYEGVEFENGLPKEWEYTKLERLANISTGKCNREDAEEDGAYPLFDRSQEIKRSNVWLKDCEAIIVPGEGTSFIPRYYNGKFNLHQRCYCVEPLEKGMGFFIYQILMMYRIYFLYVATGATVPSLRLNNFNDFKVLLPKKELCFQYNEIAEKMNDEILLLKNKNELLAKQRDILLPRLMSGKLEV